MDTQGDQGKQNNLGRRGLDRPSVQGRMARFMEPCILLLLTAERSHGYQLMEKLGHFGFDGTSSDMATLYRTLRQLEEDNMVVSAWEEGSQGPPKRVYDLTEDGRTLLGEWISIIRDNRDRLTKLLESYDSACGGCDCGHDRNDGHGHDRARRAADANEDGGMER